ncbi:MAG: D-alanyl-D-alanine carboxypeptidase family protein [Patescibacteria group bacterium]
MLSKFRLIPLLISAAAAVAAFPAGAARSLPLEEPGFATTAKAAVLMEPESGTVLYAKNDRQRLPPASITKVMTMLLIMEAVDGGRVRLDEPITASAAAAGTGGSQVYLREGEVFSLRKMLIAIAVESANDASTAVAEHLYTTEDDFVRIMNLRARQLGMRDTHFTNAHGLPDPGHYMSAADIAVVARELVAKHPRILKYTAIWTYTFRPGVTELRNTNELVKLYRGADGLKTGHTDEAGWCLVGTASRNGMRLLSVVLGTESNDARLRETRRLLDYGFRNFIRRVVAKKGQAVGSVPVAGAWGRIKAVAPANLVTIVPRGRVQVYDTRLAPKKGVRAPLEKGAVVGSLQVLQGGRVVSSQLVVAANRVGRAFFLVRGWWALLGWIRGLFAAR